MKTLLKKIYNTLFGKANNKQSGEKKDPTNEKEMLQQIPIETTPFTAVKYENKWFLAMGKYRLTEPLKSYKEVLETAKDASWNRIMQICQIVIQENEEKKKLDQTIDKQQQKISNEIKISKNKGHKLDYTANHI